MTCTSSSASYVSHFQPADSRCSGHLSAPQAGLPLRVPPGAGWQDEEVPAAAIGASLQDAYLAGTFRRQALAQRPGGPRLQRLLPQQAVEGQVAGQGLLLGVIFTVKPGYAKCLMKDAIESRNTLPLAGEKDMTKVLTIDSQILKKMLEAPVFMSKPPNT